MSSYLVVRLHPDSPVDSGTFGTYLDGLQIQVYPADAPQTAANLLGQIPPSTGLVYTPIQLIQVPWIPGTYVTAVTKDVTTSTAPKGSNDFGKELDVANTNGITFGANVTSSVDTGIFQGGTSVTDLAAKKVTVNNPIQKFVAAGTPVTFYYQYGANALTIGANFDSFSFTLKAKAAATNSTTVTFNAYDGIMVGMQVTAANGIPNDTLVTAVSSSGVTLSNQVTVKKNDVITFTCNLNSGIVQHVQQQPFDSVIGTFYVPIPASVATAIVPLPQILPAISISRWSPPETASPYRSTAISTTSSTGREPSLPPISSRRSR